MDDLVERLRKASSMPFKEAYRALFTLGADEIELLRAELSAKAWEVIDEKNQEIEHLRNHLDEANARVSEWFDECAKRIGKAAELSNQLVKAQSRVSALEMVIREDLRPYDCSDEFNRMLVDEIHNRHFANTDEMGKSHEQPS